MPTNFHSTLVKALVVLRGMLTDFRRSLKVETMRLLRVNNSEEDIRKCQGASGYLSVMALAGSKAVHGSRKVTSTSSHTAAGVVSPRADPEREAQEGQGEGGEDDVSPVPPPPCDSSLAEPMKRQWISQSSFIMDKGKEKDERGSASAEAAAAQAQEDTMAHKMGLGITGFVADMGEAYRAEEAYADPHYHALYDRAWSWQVVNNMACVPVRVQGSERVFAVLQALNKDQFASFTDEDEVNMKVYAKQLGIVLQDFGAQTKGGRGGGSGGGGGEGGGGEDDAGESKRKMSLTIQTDLKILQRTDSIEEEEEEEEEEEQYEDDHEEEEDEPGEQQQHAAGMAGALTEPAAVGSGKEAETGNLLDVDKYTPALASDESSMGERGGVEEGVGDRVRQDDGEGDWVDAAIVSGGGEDESGVGGLGGGGEAGSDGGEVSQQ